MKVHILGTGTSQGVPVIGCKCEACLSSDRMDQRLRSCVVVEQEGTFILIDSGPDLRQQMLKADIPRIDAIIYTHEHNDHMIGLDDIRPYNFMQGGDLPIYGLPRVIEELESRFAYAFKERKYPGAPQAVGYSISGHETIHVAGIEITPINVIHGRLPILGYRIGKFGFITDASALEQVEMEKLVGVEVLVINALRLQKHPAHFTLSEALSVIRQIGSQHSYITHISHLMGKHKEWSKILPADVSSAYDGLVLEL